VPSTLLPCQASSMARRFQFVTVPNPTESPSSESKKSAYSHAFRQAHAQRRREQTEKYKKETVSVPVTKVFTASKEAISSPLSQVLNSNKDLFSSLARPLSSVEYFLLDHCKSIIIIFLLPNHGRISLPFRTLTPPPKVNNLFTPLLISLWSQMFT
jgi:hypothetical protein